MKLNFTYLEQVNSTNEYAISNMSTFDKREITVIYTYNQTKGKGQIGKSWFSGEGLNLCFSILYFPEDLNAADYFKVLMRISLSIRSMLKDELGIMTKIKWPNDIYHGDKKLAGILIQNGINQKKMTYVLLGIGINVNSTKFPSDLPNPISLKGISKKSYALDGLIISIATGITERFLNPPLELIKPYNLSLYRLGEWSYFEDQDKVSFKGKILGVSNDGCLLIHSDSGRDEKYNFNEISFII